MSFSSFSSLNQDRIFQISSCLSTIQTGIDSERGTRVDQLDQKCKELELNLAEFEEQNSKKFSAHKAQLDLIFDSLSQLKETRESFFSSKSKELLDQEIVLNSLLQQSSQDKKDSDLKFQKIFDDRVNSLRSDLSRESQARADSIKSAKSFLEDKINKIEEMMSNEKVEIEKTTEELCERINENIQKSQEALEVERKAREETEEAMLFMLQDLIAKIKSEIEQERNERESSEETLLGLLEETCTKLNSLTNI